MTQGAPERLPVRRPLALLLIVGGMLIALAAAIYFSRFYHEAEDRAGSPAQAAARAEADRAVEIARLDPRQRAAMEAVVRDYILSHPEVISDAAQILDSQAADRRVAAVRVEAERPFPGAVAGNPDGRITLVEFTDYNCSYCRASVPDVKRLIAAEPQLKIIFHELPILAPSSRDAAMMALAAADQGRYLAFHDAMFAGPRPDAQSIEAAARKAGLDLPRARAFIASDRARAELERTMRLADALRLNATPTWLIDGRMIQGAVGYDQLKAAVDRVGS